MKSLKLDHPVQRDESSHSSLTMTGTLVGVHPEFGGYALVDFGDGHLVNVRMADGTVGWAGAPVDIQTGPDGMPVLGLLSSSAARPHELVPLTFGPTAKMLVENQAFTKTISDKTEAAKQEIEDAKAILAEAQARIDRVAAETPEAIQSLHDYQELYRNAQLEQGEALNSQIESVKEQLTPLTEMSKRAVELANQARDSALQAAGLIEGRGRTITQFEEPTDPEDTKTNNVWIQPISGKNAKTYIWDKKTRSWKEIDDDGVQRAAQAALDAMTTAKAAEVKAGDAVTQAGVAQSAAADAKTTAVSADAKAAQAKSAADTATVKSSEAADKAESAKDKADTAHTVAKAAEGRASTAELQANEAQTKAGEAQATAGEARSLAESADQAAKRADSKAEDAKAKAQWAKEKAQWAGSTAGDALENASNARSKAEQATSSAEEAINAATNATAQANTSLEAASRAASQAYEAQTKAGEAKAKASEARSYAASADQAAKRADSKAQGAMVEAKKAPRTAIVRGLNGLKDALSEPYREGDTIMVGDDADHITSVMVYSGGAWKRELLTVDNLVVNNAMWAKLIEADRGNIGDLIVKDRATIRRLIVTGESILKDIIVTGNANIAEAIISQITAEKINALNIKAAAIDLGPRIKADMDGIRIYNQNPDEHEDAYVTTQLTGNEQSLGIAKNGMVVGGFNSEGDLTAQDATINSLDVNQLTVGGLSLNEVIDLPEPPPSTKVVARVDGDLDYKGIGGRHEAHASVWIAEFQIHNDSDVVRMYALHTSSITIVNRTTLPRLAEFKANINTSWTPASQAADNAPTVDVVSTMLYSANYASAGLHGTFMLSEGAYANIVVRVKASADFSVKNTPFSGYVLDMGEFPNHGNARMVGYSTDREYGGKPQPDQITYVPPVPPTPPKPREYTWAATSFRTFIQSASENTSRDRSLPNRWDARSNNWAWVGPIPTPHVLRHDGSTKGIAILGAGVARTLRGATVEKVMVYVRIDHAYYGSGNKIRIYPGKTGENWGRYGNSYREVTLAQGQGTWVDMTSQFKHGLENGYITNIAFDPDGSRDRHYYAKIVDARLKVTYTS